MIPLPFPCPCQKHTSLSGLQRFHSKIFPQGLRGLVKISQHLGDFYKFFGQRDSNGKGARETGVSLFGKVLKTERLSGSELKNSRRLITRWRYRLENLSRRKAGLDFQASRASFAIWRSDEG